MAVFTEVSFDEAAALIGRLGIGELTSLKGIVSGIENTNYFADTTEGRYVLTLFERLTFEQLPFYLHLMKHLADRGIPVPGPHGDGAGRLLHVMRGKPAAVVDRLRGSHQLAPGPAHCASVGAMLARMHEAARDFRDSSRTCAACRGGSRRRPGCCRSSTRRSAELIESELAFQQALAASPACATLPRGPIHADLFRDNVMFEGGDADRLLRFLFRRRRHLVYDIAICLNDWCIDLDTGRLDEDRASAFVSGYDGVRSLSGAELRLMPAMMRAAALRFWLSRLWDLYLPRDASMLKPHDPSHFERVLRERVARPWHHIRY